MKKQKMTRETIIKLIAGIFFILPLSGVLWLTGKGDGFSALLWIAGCAISAPLVYTVLYIKILLPWAKEIDDEIKDAVK